MKKLRRYTPEQIAYLKEIASGRYNNEIAELFNQKFGTDLTAEQIKSVKARYSIRSNVIRYRPGSSKKLFTEEQERFIRENYKGISNQELADLINEKFGLSITSKQIANYKKRNGFDSGLTGRFKKGHVPWNKGLKGINTGGEAGWFKKGHLPLNYKPIGSERIDKKDGYVLVKVQDHGLYQERWRLKHVVLWEKVHGKVPEDHVIAFLNGDKTDIRIDNLVLLSRTELAQMVRYGYFSNDPELTKAGIQLIRLQNKIGEFELTNNNPEQFLKYMKLAEKNRIKKQTFIARLKRGWSIKDAATLPLYSKPKRRKLGGVS